MTQKPLLMSLAFGFRGRANRGWASRSAGLDNAIKDTLASKQKRANLITINLPAGPQGPRTAESIIRSLLFFPSLLGR